MRHDKKRLAEVSAWAKRARVRWHLVDKPELVQPVRGGTFTDTDPQEVRKTLERDKGVLWP